MKNEEKKILEEVANRYLKLAGIQLNEQVEDVEKIYEPVEGAASGGENLVNPIDHAKITSDESSVQGVEKLDLVTGEVTTSEITVEKIEEIVSKVRSLIESRKKSN